MSPSPPLRCFLLSSRPLRRPLSLPHFFNLLPPHTTTPNNSIRSHSSTSSSVNPTEVSHFNALASTWWDPSGSSRLLHLMNPLRHDFINSCLSSAYNPSPHPGIRYLDVGCGGGIFTESAARLSTTEFVLGIDPSAEVISIARQHALRDPLLAPVNHPQGASQQLKNQRPQRLEYKQTSIEALDVPKSIHHQYDVLTLFEVIEHITHPAPFLERCLPFVKPGGWLVLSTIARTYTSWFTTKLVAEDLVGIVPRGTHDWGKYINEGELKEWFEKQQGWGRSRTMGVVYFPGLGWKEVRGGEKWGNYFFGVRKNDDD